MSAASLGVCAAVACAATACRDNPADTTTTTGAAQPKTVVIPQPDPTTGQPAAGSLVLSDGQILGVVHTANQGEIAQGKLAEERATDPRVKHFAAMMVAEHTEMDDKGAGLGAKAGMPTGDSPISLSVQMNGDHAMSELKSKTGAEFDKAYIAAQVTEHQAVLDTIDQRLMPSASNDDLKALLRGARSKVAEHLERAKYVQSQLGTAP